MARERCDVCGRDKPTEAEWSTVPEGGRPDLCWESGADDCRNARRPRDVDLKSEIAETRNLALAAVAKCDAYIERLESLESAQRGRVAELEALLGRCRDVLTYNDCGYDVRDLIDAALNRRPT
jgi:hypothetical protein